MAKGFNDGWGGGDIHGRIRMEPQDPNAPIAFNASRLYDTHERLNIQNMLMVAYRAPSCLPKGHKACEVWSDRSYLRWQEATQDLRSRENDVAFWHGVSSRDLMKFAKRMAEGEGIDGIVTGARVVRYTNRSSGYPCHRLDIIYKPAAAVYREAIGVEAE